MVQFENYLVVDRSAQIYCWAKHRRDDLDVWEREWQSKVPSNHRNDGISQALRSGRLTPDAYHVDKLEISPRNLHFADDQETVSPRSVTLSQQGKDAGLRADGDYFYLRKHTGGGDQLGDERISYRAIPMSATVSYFGLIQDQIGKGKVFEKKSGFVSKIILDDGVFHHLVRGDRDTALATLKGHLQRVRWIVRIAGTVGSMFGVAMTLGRLLHLLMGIPILGRLVRGGLLLISVIIGGCLAVATMAASWLVHHPVLAALVIGSLFVVGYWLNRQRKISKENANKVLERLEASPVGLAPESNEATGPSRAEHVFQHLVKIAISDGKFDKTENTFLADWARTRNIPDESIVNLFNQAKGEEGLHPLEATREDLFYLISLSLADDHLSADEFKRIQRFAKDLAIGAQELESIIQGIRNGRLASAGN